MRKYSTGQRKLLLEFLEQHPDKQFSVEQITDTLCDTGAISASAIYRNINAMVAEGLVGRFPAPGSKKFLYQYIGKETCKEHMHLKCENCGQLFHMDNQTMNTVQSSINQTNSFKIDVKKTILYGTCEDCDLGESKQ